MYALPSNPKSVGDITPDDYQRLCNSSQRIPLRQCITCRGPLPPIKERFIRWYRDGNPKAEIVEYACDCVEQAKLHYYLLNSGLGTRFQRLGWLDTDSVPKDARNEVLRYMSKAEAYVHRGIGMVLRGEMGNGKSMMAALWLKGMIARGFSGYFVSYTSILRLYRSTWAKDEEKYDFERRILNAQLLVLDDLGVHEWVEEQEKKENKGRLDMATRLIDQVIRTRVDFQQPTVITTNRNNKQLGQLYSDHAMSLLSGSAQDIEFAGADFRPESQSRDNIEIDAGITRPLLLA